MPDTLYHYCSNDAFLSIIQSRKIRLSSLSLANDTAEGKLVGRLIKKLAAEDGLKDTVVDEILDSMRFVESNVEGFAFCLSRKGDLLSQWRGYAADGTGVCIGFNTRYLDQLSKGKSDDGKLLKVIYDEKTQIEELRNIYNTARHVASEIDLHKSPFRIPRPALDPVSSVGSKRFQLGLYMLKIVNILFAFKGFAFEEEAEHRLIHFGIVNKPNEWIYATKNDRIIPYVEYELQDLGQQQIFEVVLGPKNRTPLHVIKGALISNGFGAAEVRLSEATYR